VVSAPAPAAPSIRQTALPFYFLQYRVGTWTFPAADRNADWLGGEPRTDAALAAPEQPPPDGCDAAIVRSQPLAGPLPALVFGPAWIRYLRRRYPRRYIDMRGTFADYLRAFSSKSRSTLTRKVRRLTEAGGGRLDARVYATAAEIAEFHGLAREISRKTYQERLFDAGLPDDAAYRAELEQRAAAGAVRGFLLFLGGTPVAYLLCPVDRDRLLYGFLGHDPAVARLSPGTVLQYAALEQLFAERCFAIFDFTEGDGPHKEFFATHHRDCGDLYYFRRTGRNVLAVSTHRALDRGSTAARRVLAGGGLTARLKRVTRGGGRRGGTAQE
jgi:CelD/BcsL family acetyltransferase involved in cellulose biosynthesis